MLEGLPPNNAAHMPAARQRRAPRPRGRRPHRRELRAGRGGVDRVRDRRSLAGRRQGLAHGGLFRLRAGRGGDPRADRRRVGRGDRALGDLRPDGEARLGRQLARRPEAGARRALSRSWAPTTARASGRTTSRSRSRRGSPSAPAITARRAAVFCISTGCSSAAGRARARRRLRRGRARHRRRQGPAPQGLARRHRSGRGRGRQRQRAAERRRRFLPGDRLARRRERAPCARARLTTSCSPTSWRSPCGCSRRRSRRS